MILRTCIGRYSEHLAAIIANSKMVKMRRITYNEKKFDIELDKDELEKDQNLLEQELE